MNDAYHLYQELTELRKEASSTVSDMIMMLNELQPDEPEMYEFHQLMDRAYALLKRLNGDRDES